MVLSIMTLSKTIQNVTFSIITPNILCCYGKCSYAQCHIFIVLKVCLNRGIMTLSLLTFSIYCWYAKLCWCCLSFNLRHVFIVMLSVMMLRVILYLVSLWWLPLCCEKYPSINSRDLYYKTFYGRYFRNQLKCLSLASPSSIV